MANLSRKRIYWGILGSSQNCWKLLANGQETGYVIARTRATEQAL